MPIAVKKTNYVAVDQSKTWQTAFDINFTTATPASYTSNGEVTIGGQNFVLHNMVNADSVSVSSAGLVIDPNGNNAGVGGAGSDLWVNEFTAPAALLPITRSIPDFNLFDYQLRLWTINELTGSNQDSEYSATGFTKYPPISTTSLKYFVGIGRGYAAGTNNISFWRFYNNIQSGGGATTGLTDNFNKLIWRGVDNVDGYCCQSSLSDSFETANSKMKLLGSYNLFSSNSFNASLHEITGSGDLSIGLVARPSNTLNSFQATWRRIRLDYRKL